MKRFPVSRSAHSTIRLTPLSVAVRMALPAAMGLGTPYQGYAEESASEEATVLSTVTVVAKPDALFDEPPEQGGFKGDYQRSATKTTLTIRETPQSISVVTRESMDVRQAHDVNSALELTAGVSIAGGAFAGSSPRTGEGFVLRGQPLDSSRDVRIDGFSSMSDRNNIDLAPFERIEVVKGPSSMLYGQGSLGGFINMVRKKPQAESSADVMVQAGSFDTYRTEVDVAGALDAEKRLAGQMTLAYEDSGSFVDGVESTRRVVAPSMEMRISERTRALLQIIYQEDSFIPSLGIPLRQEGNELKMPHVSRSFFFGVPSTEHSTASTWHSTLQLDHQFADRWLASLVLNTSQNKLKGISDSYGYGIDTLGNTDLYASWVAHDDEIWAGEFRLDGKFDAFGREHDVLLGVEKNRKDFDSWGGYTGPIGTVNIYTDDLSNAPSIPAGSLPIAYDDEIEGDNEGFYGQVRLHVLDHTRLLLGMRMDRAQQERDGSFGNQQQFDEESTYRVAVIQELSSDITSYASYAQSFNPVQDITATGDILDPETGEGYEIGLKSEWFDHKLGATVAVFRQELDNRPIFDPNNGPGDNFSISGGLQRTDGAELEVTGSPMDGLTLGFAATWLDAQYTDPLDLNYRATPDGTTEEQYSIFTSYELQDGNLKGLELGGTVVSVGERTVLSGNQNLYVDGYDRLDLHAGYKGWRDWNLMLQVRNVLDEKYVERPNSAYAYGHFFGAPRAILLRTEYKFR